MLDLGASTAAQGRAQRENGWNFIGMLVSLGLALCQKASCSSFPKDGNSRKKEVFLNIRLFVGFHSDVRFQAVE